MAHRPVVVSIEYVRRINYHNMVKHNSSATFCSGNRFAHKPSITVIVKPSKKKHSRHKMDEGDLLDELLFEVEKYESTKSSVPKQSVIVTPTNLTKEDEKQEEILSDSMAHRFSTSLACPPEFPKIWFACSTSMFANRGENIKWDVWMTDSDICTWHREEGTDFGSNVTIHPNGSLELQNVSTSDGGVYYCRISAVNKNNMQIITKYLYINE